MTSTSGTAPSSARPMDGCKAMYSAQFVMFVGVCFSHERHGTVGSATTTTTTAAAAITTATNNNNNNNNKEREA